MKGSPFRDLENRLMPVLCNLSLFNANVKQKASDIAMLSHLVELWHAAQNNRLALFCIVCLLADKHASLPAETIHYVENLNLKLKFNSSESSATWWPKVFLQSSVRVFSFIWLHYVTCTLCEMLCTVVLTKVFSF